MEYCKKSKQTKLNSAAPDGAAVAVKNESYQSAEGRNEENETYSFSVEIVPKEEYLSDDSLTSESKPTKDPLLVKPSTSKEQTCINYDLVAPKEELLFDDIMPQGKQNTVRAAKPSTCKKRVSVTPDKCKIMLQCSTCLKYFSDEDIFNCHKMMHMEEKQNLVKFTTVGTTVSGNTAAVGVKNESDEPDIMYSSDIDQKSDILELALLERKYSKYKKCKKPFSCDHCKYTCTEKNKLLCHMETHIGIKTYTCNLCNYQCDVENGLAEHMKSHTRPKQLFSCKLCDYTCIHNSKLQIHMKTHTDIKPYSCTLCNYKCARTGYLVIHMRTHTGEKPFSCTLCNYRCTQHGKLVNHMRSHTGVKPYSCKLCDYRCAVTSSLVKHMRIHSGEKPYACKLCDYRSSANSNLLRHMRRHTETLGV